MINKFLMYVVCIIHVLAIVRKVSGKNKTFSDISKSTNFSIFIEGQLSKRSFCRVSLSSNQSYSKRKKS